MKTKPLPAAMTTSARLIEERHKRDLLLNAANLLRFLRRPSPAGGAR